MLGTAPSLSPSCCSLDEGQTRRNPGTFAMTWIALHPGYKLTESYLSDTILGPGAHSFCHANRQLADALTGGGEDGIGHRGRGTGNARLADPARLLCAGHDMHLDLRRLVDAQHGIVMKIALLHAAIGKREFAIERRRQPEDHRALHLRFDDVGVDRPAAVHGAYHAMHANLAAAVDRHFGDLRNVASK